MLSALKGREHHRQKAAHRREPLTFKEVYVASGTTADFRRNPRGELGTRTATLSKAGIEKLREGWVYKNPSMGPSGEG